MFTAFSADFYRLCAEREYRMQGDGASKQSIADTPVWSLYKQENASLCLLHVVDCARVDWAQLYNARDAEKSKADQFAQETRGLYVLYILVGAGAADDATQSFMAAAEPFIGQAAYFVYWRVDLTAKSVVVPDGQPGELFGLRKMIAAVLEKPELQRPESQKPESPDSLAVTFEDVAQQAAAASPFVKKKRRPIFSMLLIGINAVVVALMYLSGYADDTLAVVVRFGAIEPERMLAGHEWYRLFTAMFVHIGVSHFLANALGLYVFGTRVEWFIGRVRFLVIYIVAGLCGSAASLLITRAVSAGASGGVYGLIGAVFVYTVVSKRAMDMLTGYTMLIYIGVGLALGYMTPGIDNVAHIGGLLAGMAVGWVFVHQKNPADSRG